MIHYPNEFNKGEAQSKLESLKTKFTWEAGSTVKEVSANVDTLIADFYATGFVPYPKMVVTPTYYAGDNGEFSSASFTVRPSTTALYYSPNMKTQFTLFAGESFYSRLVSNFAEWFDDYIDTALEYDNLHELAKVIDEVVTENEIPFAVKLDIGDGILDIADDSITVGIKSAVLRTITKLSLFNTVIPSAPLTFRQDLAEALKACARPADLVKQNCAILGPKVLNIFSRKSIEKLIRQRVTRQLAYVRVGVGYVKTADWFAVVEKTVETAAQAEEIKANLGDKVIIVDNKKPTVDEKTKNQTKIAIRFKVSPFNENNEAVSVALSDVPNITKAND